MLAARRAYADVIRWMKVGRSTAGPPSRFAASAFRWVFVTTLGAWSIVGIISPSSFGQTGRKSFAVDWRSEVLVVLILAAGLSLFARRQDLLRQIARVREPFVRRLEDAPGFEGALGALSACPGILRVRFSVGWVWGPVVVAGAGGIFGTSTTYFVVDAVLARFDVGWGQPVLAAANAALGLICFAMSARRLATWRLALSVSRSAGIGY